MRNRLRFRVLVGICVLAGPSVSLLSWSAPALAAGAPVVDSESVSHVGTASATLSAAINPEGSTTTYHFEYGPTASYGTSIPAVDATVGSGSEEVTVGQALSSLEAGTLYHYRVVATSTAGTTSGPDRVLKTYPLGSGAIETCPNAGIRETQFSTYLADCRAYEMVSPPEKEGANVAAIAFGATRSSLDGGAIKYDSGIGFGELVGTEGDGYEYVSVRGPEGWSTHSLNPREDSLPIGLFASSQYVAFSEDLSKGVYLGFRPVVGGHPNVEHASNLYLRSDLFSGPPGSYELLTDSAGPVPPLTAIPEGSQEGSVGYADASADFTHVIFQSQNDMTTDVAGLNPELPKLYEWVNGSVRLAGILPDGKPAESSVAGRGAGGGENQFNLNRHNWSADTISLNGSRIVFTAAPFSFGEDRGAEGNLYMRIDGRETVQLNRSERSTPDSTGAQPAEFWGATPDDSKVFFITTGLLTDDASGESADPSSAKNARNLYMYDINAPEGKHLTLISVDKEPSDDGQGGCCGRDRASNVPAGGISADGNYVYFQGEDQLVRGHPHPKTQWELYVWHDGVVSAVVEHEPQITSGGQPWGEEGAFAQKSAFRTTPDGHAAIFVMQGQAELESATSAAGIEMPRPLATELFFYNAETNKLVCVSCNPSGADPKDGSDFNHTTGFNFFEDARPFTEDYSDYLSRALSQDGRYVFFNTVNALLPQDTNGESDVYEYDTQNGELHLVSSGTCGCASTFVDASGDGSSVFFTTHQSLVRADVDTNSDMYVARIDGGIQGQNEPPAKVCEGDDCQGPAKLAPAFSLPSSSTFAGVGNNSPVSPSGSAKPKSKPLPNAEKLTKALEVCQKKQKRKRVACETQAMRRYGAKRARRARGHNSRRAGL